MHLRLPTFYRSGHVISFVIPAYNEELLLRRTL